jgi:hypothetical protein
MNCSFMDDMSKHGRKLARITLLTVGMTMSCTGFLSGGPESNGGGAGPSPVKEPGTEPQAGANGFEFSEDAKMGPRLRLKSNVEIYAAIREVFSVTPKNAKTLPPESVDKVTGFANNSTAHRLGQELYLSLDVLAAEVAGALPEATVRKPCSGSGSASGLGCAKAIVQDYGQRLFSRDVSAEEVESYSKVFTAVTMAKGSELEALRAVVEGLLQAFEFRVPNRNWHARFGRQESPADPQTKSRAHWLRPYGKPLLMRRCSMPPATANCPPAKA